MSKYDIVKITDDFKQLQNACQSEEQTKSIIDGFDYKTSFEHGLRPFIDQFPALCAFTGGLASVFPGTSSVETGFSIIRWGKNDCQTSLTNFSLEGILHSKQYDLLKCVSP